MTPEELIHEATLGGPGLDGYAFNADVLCRNCAEKYIHEHAKELAKKIESTDDPSFQDSEVIPQPIFFGEADSAQHCGDCGEYLYGEDPDDDLD